MNYLKGWRPTVTVALGLGLLSSCSGSSSTARVATSAPALNTATTATTDVVHLLVLGDSIAIPTMGCGSCEGFDRQYAAFLETALGRSVELYNQARGGATILDLESLLDSDAAIQAEIAQADVVVVSIGYNSGAPFGSNDPCHAPDAIHDIDQLNAILSFTPECIQETLQIRRRQLEAVYARLETLAAKRPQLRVTFGVFNNLKDNPGGDGTFADFAPADMTKVASIMVSLTNDWNTMNCEVATAHRFVCADLYHAFNGPDGTASVKELVSADFTHPSERGQAVMAQLLEKVPLDQLQ